ncbi:MAG: aminomethyl-transferring glycine dehydrogenase [Myxococcota bacterium]
MTETNRLTTTDLLKPSDGFIDRHIGPRHSDIATMLNRLEVPSLDALVDAAVPSSIRMERMLDLGEPATEHRLLREFKAMMSANVVARSFIGMGYSGTITPPVILRNILENPGWYTQYTPYQAEIAQGRLEALLNYQTMVLELTGLEIANASLLDEGTAAAEAMTMCHGIAGRKTGDRLLVSTGCHPQTIAVLQTRAEPLGITVEVADPTQFALDNGDVFAVVLQYPTTLGVVEDYEALCERVHAAGGLVIVAADLLALTLLRPPGEFGADVAVGNTQRFGVPMGFGGPHAAYFATREAHKRRVPGRLVGVSRDRDGQSALRLALQTREQHIRRAKATSNICTSQVLLAIIAGMYAVYHGPEGLERIARRVNLMTRVLGAGLRKLGWHVGEAPCFDTLMVEPGRDHTARLVQAARDAGMNLRQIDDQRLTIALDETTEVEDLRALWTLFSDGQPERITWTAEGLAAEQVEGFNAPLGRTSAYLTHPIFHTHRSETELLRYIHRLQSRDLSLTTSMIPLGSCTMKLNATAEMIPVTWPEVGGLHPFAPAEQTAGYQQLFRQLEGMLAEITGFSAVSLQPNAGSQGEYAGLLVIRRYHQERGEGHRNICLIPESAHGTNPASAVMAGMKVIVVRCDDQGNVDLDDLQAKANKHSENLAALMVTYPSTHGVFESAIRDICTLIHDHGGQVYMDGANLNAQVGLCQPGQFGIDVCHLNLHKTFCIPHGGGGPGMGPIAVGSHLAPHLPSHPEVEVGGGSETGIGPVSAAPWGSPSILPISWMYIRLMGSQGLTLASKVSILNANVMARRLEPYYPVLYKGEEGWVAHECIIDLRHFKKATGITVTDVAKRLMDYGFHAPTVSWPVAGTMMIEPTESESLEEIDRFCDAMIAIRAEIQAIEDGALDREVNPLTMAPHTAEHVASASWDRPYPRELGAFPSAATREHKFWPAVGRIDDAYGDRNLVCSCLPLEAYEEV